ncbi:hypothetical protein Tco_0127260 [Tanacetum coccineum]
MSSASSAFTYTSVYTDSEPGRPVASPSSDYAPGPKHPPSPVEVLYVPEPEYHEYLVPSDDEAPMEEQPLPADASPVALSPGYVADSDLEEDSEEDHADYLADGGDDDIDPSDDDDDDDDIGDEDEEPFEVEEDDEEEKDHLALTDSPAAPVIDPVPSAEDTEAFKTDEAAPTHVVERLLALPILPPSPLTPLSSPQPQIPSPSSLHLPPPVPTSLPLPLFPLPPLPASPFISPVDFRRCPRPTGGHGADYGFIGTMDAEVRRQRTKEVGYDIRDVWVDPEETDIYAVIEDTQGRQTQIYYRVDILAEDRQFHYETARLLDQEALVSREAWAYSIGLSMTVHYDMQDSCQRPWDRFRHFKLEIRLMQNNMPPKRTSAAATAALMTAVAVKQLIKARVVPKEWLCSHNGLKGWNQFSTLATVLYRTKLNTEEDNPKGEIKKLEVELWNLKVKGINVASYTLRFQELALMCKRMFYEESKEVEKYVGGLPDMIR